MTVTEALNIVVKCIKSGTHVNIIALALTNDGFAPQRAETIIAWAKQSIEKESNEHESDP